MLQNVLPVNSIPGSVAVMRDPNSSEGMMVLLNPGGIG